MKEKSNGIRQGTFRQRVYCVLAVLLFYVLFIPVLNAGITVEAGDTLPQGLWKTERVTVEKSAYGYDGQTAAGATATYATTTAEYNSIDDIKSHIPCPQEWRISEKDIVLHYSDGIEATIENKLEDDRLTLCAYDGTMQVYQCRVMDGNLMMTVTFEYNVISPVRPGEAITTRQVEKVTETWVIALKKSDANE